MTDPKDPKGLRKPTYTIDEIDTFMRRAIERRNGASQQSTELPVEEVVRLSHDELLETLKTAPDFGVSPDDVESVIAEEMKIRSAKAEVEAIMPPPSRRPSRPSGACAGRGFVVHVVAFMTVSAVLFAIDKLTTGGTWFYYPVPVWGLAVAAHAIRLSVSEGRRGARGRGEQRGPRRSSARSSSRRSGRATRAARRGVPYVAQGAAAARGATGRAADAAGSEHDARGAGARGRSTRSGAHDAEASAPVILGARGRFRG